MGAHIATCCLGLFLAFVPALSAQTDYHITIQAEPRQTFRGFGSSQVSMEFGHFAPEPFRSRMADLIYRDLRAKVLRLWVASGPDVPLETMKSEFYRDYVNDGVISLITQRGVTTLLLAPARGPEKPKDSMQDYAIKLAQFIADVRKEKGVEIAVTGIANEPEGWTGEQLAEAIKQLRFELDKRSLTQVEIVAPENPSANEILDAQLDHLRADSDAWKNLSGIASHSYNMAVRDSAAARAHGKSYWMTEASDDGNEHGEDENRASSIAARFLNDLNHLVTHWNFFKGFSYSPDVTTDNYTASRLTQYDAATGKIVTHLKYYYLKTLLSVFEPGCVLRRCESETEKDMVFTYGQKPKVCAAAGINPDGSFAIGVVNLTGVTPNDSITQWQPAETLRVTVRLPESGRSSTFQMHRCRAGQHGVRDLAVEVKQGMLTFVIEPRELVCLRSEASVKK